MSDLSSQGPALVEARRVCGDVRPGGEPVECDLLPEHRGDFHRAEMPSGVVAHWPMRRHWSWAPVCQGCGAVPHAMPAFEASVLEVQSLGAAGVPSSWSCRCLGGRPAGPLTISIIEVDAKGHPRALAPAPAPEDARVADLRASVLM